MLREARPAVAEAPDAALPKRAGRARVELPYVLRSSTTDDLKAYLDGPEPAETAWLSPERQHEEAWFLGLRLNAGVKLAALRGEFGREPVARALEAVTRLKENDLLTSDGKTVRLTAQGRLLSNDVFQEFLENAADEDAVRQEA
jgi:oxygen-independent coproporphyrinogen-3 oxidase